MTAHPISSAEMGGRFAGCGCVYVAFGYEYLMLAAHSARTLKAHNPGLATLLITNVPVEPLVADGHPLFDTVMLREAASEQNRRDKLSVDEISPFEKTVFLDCDTEVRGDLGPVFGLLDDYDIAVRLLNRVSSAAFDVYPGISASALGLAEWNTGVLFFRKSDPTVAMFRKWRNLFLAEGMARDQPAFTRAVLSTPQLRLLPLGPMWNAKPTIFHEYHYMERDPGSIRILHYREPLRRPDIARAVNQTFRDIKPKLAADGDDVRATGEALRAEEARFRSLYATYAWFLRPFDNRLGRRFLRDNQQLVRRILRGIFFVRSRLRGVQTVAPGRNQRSAGQQFKREPRR